jgi:hypothetical protein
MAERTPKYRGSKYEASDSLVASSRVNRTIAGDSQHRGPCADARANDDRAVRLPPAVRGDPGAGMSVPIVFTSAGGLPCCRSSNVPSRSSSVAPVGVIRTRAASFDAVTIPFAGRRVTLAISASSRREILRMDLRRTPAGIPGTSKPSRNARDSTPFDSSQTPEVVCRLDTHALNRSRKRHHSSCETSGSASVLNFAPAIPGESSPTAASSEGGLPVKTPAPVAPESLPFS